MESCVEQVQKQGKEHVIYSRFPHVYFRWIYRVVATSEFPIVWALGGAESKQITAMLDIPEGGALNPIWGRKAF